MLSPTVYKGITHGLSRVLKTPPYLILFVNDTCWMKCKHCWFNEDWKEKETTRPALTTDELEKLASSIDRLLFLSLTGGEAFRRDDIVYVTEMFARKTRLSRYQIPTSGYDPELIVRSAEQMLMRNRDLPFRVDVSLDGTEHTHEIIRRAKDGWKRALETIKGLNRLKERYSYFDVGVITTISHHNQGEVKEIGALVEQINPGGEWMVNITRGNPRDPRAVDVDKSAYEQAHQVIEKRIAEGRYRGHSGHFFASWLSAKNATRRKVIGTMLDGKHPGGGCAAGSLGGVIYVDGTVNPCEMLEQSLGNIRDFDYNLPALWSAPTADKVRDWIQDTRCVCTQECFLSMSLLIQPNVWPDMIKERLKLMV